MVRQTLENSENLDPQIFSCIDIRHEECFHVADLSTLQKLEFRTFGSEGTVLEVDRANDAEADEAECSTFDKKEQPTKLPRKRDSQQFKKTAQIGERAVFWCEQWKVLLGLMWSGLLIAGADGTPIHDEDFNKLIIKELGEQVNITLQCPDKCHLDFFSPEGRYVPICYKRMCKQDCYRIDDMGSLVFTASIKTAGKYRLTDYNTNVDVDTFQVKLLQCVDGAEHRHLDCKITKKLGDEVKVPLGCPEKRRVDFFNPEGGCVASCAGGNCQSSHDYRIDDTGNLFFSASVKTAGKYHLIDYDTNKTEATFQLKLLYENPPKSGASSNMPSGLLVALGFVVLGFYICPF